MKALYTILLMLFGVWIWQASPIQAQISLNIDDSSDLNKLCPGQEFTLSINALGVTAPGNQFIVQLSDPNGSFAGGGTLLNPSFPGEGTNLTDFIIKPVLPTKLPPPGAGYRLRISGTSPQRNSPEYVVKFFTVSYFITDQTCFGDRGRIAVRTYGGKKPVEYWVNNTYHGSDSIFNGLLSGPYNLRIRDADGCEISDTIQIRFPSEPILAIDKITPFEFGCEDTVGILRVEARKLDPRIQRLSFRYFNLTNGTNSGSAVLTPENEFKFTNITPGTYRIVVGGENISCTVEDTFIVKPSKIAVINGGGVSKILCRDTVGEVTVYGNWLYLDFNNKMCFWWRNDNTGETSPVVCSDNNTYTFTGVKLGAYTIFVKDSINGCTSSAPLQVQAGSQAEDEIPVWIEATEITTDVTCYGGNDGSIYVEFIKGYQNKLYVNDVWYKDTIYEGGGQVLISNLKAGEYNLKVVDGFCQPVFYPEIVITEPSKFSADNYFPSDPNCGKNDGRIRVSVTGGTPPYAYKLTGMPAFSSDSTFNNLKAGIYYLTVKDSKGCEHSFTDPVVLKEKGKITVDSLVTVPSCAEAPTGTVRVYARSAGGSLEYTLNGATNLTGIFTGLTPTEHQIKITDRVNSCVLDTAIKVETYPVPTVSLAPPVSPLCFDNQNTGVIRITNVTGGVPPFLFSLDNVSFKPEREFTQLPPETYTLYVKYAGSCVQKIENIILQAPTELILIPGYDNAGCKNARLSLAAVGGQLPYLFRVLPGNGTFVSENVFPAEHGKQYRAAVKDANGCIDSITVSIPQIQTLTIRKYEVKPATCSGRKDASFSIEVFGNGEIVLEINGTEVKRENNLLRYSQTNITPATVLQVRIRDVIGCRKDTIFNIPDALPIRFLNPILILPGCTPGSGSIKILPDRSNGERRRFQFRNGAGGNFTFDSTFTGLSAGTFQITVRDFNQPEPYCDTTIEITLPAGADIQINRAEVLRSPCKDESTGSVRIELVSAAGSAQYSLNGGAFQPNSQFDGLPAGNYRAIVRDGNCADTLDFVLENSPLLVLQSVQSYDIRCKNETNGKIVIEATGGTPPLTYSIDGGNNFFNQNTFADLRAGTYNVIVRDGNNCQTPVQTAIIGVKSKFTISAAVVSSSCKGTVVKITAKDTSGKVQYSLFPDKNFGESNVLTVTGSGNVFFYAKDTVGCLEYASLDIPSLAPIRLSIVTDTALCFGEQVNFTGAVRVQAWGKGIFTVKLYSSERPNDSTIFSDLVNRDSVKTVFNLKKAGTYRLVLNDESNCPKDTQIIIHEPLPLRFTSVSADSATCTAPDGRITVTGSGGKGTLRYRLNGGAANPSGIFPGLAGGTTYRLTIEDNNGCTSSDSLFELPVKSPLKISLQNVTGGCAGSKSGKLTVGVTGAYPGPVTYTLSAPFRSDSVNTTGIYEKLIPDSSYTLTAEDAGGCRRTLKVKIPLRASVKLNPAVVTGSCKGTNAGRIEISSTGGTPPLTYTLSSKTGLSVNNGSGFFGGLIADTVYSVKVTDAGGCSDVIIGLKIPMLPAAEVAVNLKSPACFDETTGEITVEVITGAAPLQFSKDNGTTFQNEAVFQNLTAGTYEILVRSAQGCDTLLTGLTLTQPPRLLLPSVTSENLKCYNSKDGTITLALSGGTPPYRITLGPLPERMVNSPFTFTGLEAGTYAVLIRDAAGCTLTAVPPQTLTQPDPVSFTAQNQNPACNNQNDGSIRFDNASGGVPPYEYSIDNGTTFGSQQEFKNLGTGNYRLIVRDSKGCQSNEQDVRLTSSEITLLALPEICINKKVTGSQTIDLKPFAKPEGGNWSGTGVSGNIFTYDENTPEGTITLTYEQNGCRETAELKINKVVLSVSGLFVCFNEKMFILPKMTSGGSWSGFTSEMRHISGNDTVLLSGNIATQIIKLSYKVGNCSDELELNLLSVPKAGFNGDRNLNELTTDEPVKFTAETVGNAPGSTYLWSFGDGQTGQGPEISYSYTRTGTFKVGLKVISPEGCADSITKEVKAEDPFRVDMPNIFTPNSDGSNDFFPPKGYFPANVQVKMQIYGRTGQIMFETNGNNEVWDGKDAADGTYFWVLELKDPSKPDRQKVVRQGSITLLR